ncbi:MAG TPA: HK97 gp10 family phage protein [Egibacteraceae bacterium]|nr:HK97 gp10 family phage protein [Egibacteraceae bacterium]
MGPIYIRVEGLNEWVRSLKAADRQLGVEVRRALNEAAEIVAREARPRYPRSSGKLQGSVKPRSTQREAGVQVGTPGRVPYAGWIDFGGTIRHHGSRHSHSTPHLIRRPVVRGGRYLYPAYSDRARDVENEARQALERMARRTGMW